MSCPARRFAGDNRIDLRIEKVRLKPGEHLIERFALFDRERRARLLSRVGGGGKRRGRALEDELAGCQIVVRTRVDPEKLGVPLDLVERGLLDLLRMRDDGLEHVAHLEARRVPLIVENIAARHRRLIQMPDERFFFQRALEIRRRTPARSPPRRRARADTAAHRGGARPARRRVCVATAPQAAIPAIDMTTMIPFNIRPTRLQDCLPSLTQVQVDPFHVLGRCAPATAVRT